MYSYHKSKSHIYHHSVILMRGDTPAFLVISETSSPVVASCIIIIGQLVQQSCVQQLWHERKVDGFVMLLGVMVHARTVSCVAAAMAR